MLATTKGLPIEKPAAEKINLVQRLQSKEEAAVEELVRTFSDRLLRVATLILKDAHLAEDVVQESLLDAVAHIEQLRSDAALYSWLYRILVRRCRKQQRKRAWNMLVFQPKEWLQSVEDSRPRAEDLLEDEAGFAEVRKAIARLPAHYREVIALFYYEEASLEEIVAITKEPVGTIKSRLHRARKRLGKLIGEEGD